MKVFGPVESTSTSTSTTTSSTSSSSSRLSWHLKQGFAMIVFKILLCQGSLAGLVTALL